MSVPRTASELSSEDFELFWEWLTYKKGCPLTARKAEISKVIRVFETLSIFESNAAAVEFVKSWDSESGYNVLAYELRVGLLRLAPSQFQKFYRFVMALQVKNREDQAKDKKREQEERIRRQRSQRKGSQYEKAIQARKEKRNNRSLAIHPAEIEEKNAGEVADIRTFKAKHGLEEKKGPAKKFLTFVRNVSECSFQILTSSGRVLEKKSSSGASSDTSITPEETSNDTIRSMERALSIDSDDGFSSRLSKATLSLFQNRTCGDEAISSYRRFDVPSDIVESLESFGSINLSSHPFDDMEVRDM